MDVFVKESYGVIWHFYHNRHGICFCKMKDDKISKYQVLIPDGQEDFDVIIDDTDTLHLVCQNTEGDILYFNYHDSKWGKATLLKSKNPTNYKKDFVIKRVGNWLNLFYCINYNGNRMLTHHMFERQGETPTVVDCIGSDFSVALDSLGNIYALFFSETHKKPGVRKYLWSQKRWEDFSPIDELLDAKNYFLYIDKEDKMHILFELSGCVKSYVEGEVKLLGTGTSPIMLDQNGELVMWSGEHDNKVYIRRHDDLSPTVFMPGGFSKPLRFKLRYTSYEPNIRAEMCLGNIVDGAVKTYGVKNFFVVSSTPPAVSPINPQGTEAHSEPNTSYIELQKLKIQIGRLQSIIEKLQSEIETLNAQKIDRRLNELEETVDKKLRNKILNSLF